MNEAVYDLLDGDPVFGEVVKRVGPVELRPVADSHFAALARSIIHQQLATRAAATIHSRVLEAVGGIMEPERILAAPEAALRAAGLSAGKLRALRDLAEKTGTGAVPLADIDRLDDREVVERLVQVRGIGVWTAQMFLLFQLRRPDIWPTGDLGVRAGWARLHGLAEPLPAPAMEPLADRYRPWRSAVAWYCWRALDLDVAASGAMPPGPPRGRK